MTERKYQAQRIQSARLVRLTMDDRAAELVAQALHAWGSQLLTWADDNPQRTTAAASSRDAGLTCRDIWRALESNTDHEPAPERCSCLAYGIARGGINAETMTTQHHDLGADGCAYAEPDNGGLSDPVPFEPVAPMDARERATAGEVLYRKTTR